MIQLKPTKLFAVPVPENYHNSQFGLEVLGSVTKDAIDFDVEPFVMTYNANYETYYRNYPEEDYSCDNCNESFYSLLRANEVLFENPYIDPQLDNKPFCRDCADENGVCPNDGSFCDPDLELKRFKEYKSKINSKYLIIKPL